MNYEIKPISNISKIALVISNSVPVFGVFFLQWNINSIMFLYFLETLVILIFSIIKIIKAQGDATGDQNLKVTINGVNINNFNKKALIKFSVINNGILILICLVLFLLYFGIPKISFYSLYIALFSIVISHYISYYVNYIGKEEFLKISPARTYLIPGIRIKIIIFALVLGSIYNEYIGVNTMTLLIMIMLKTSVDLYSHIKEHKYKNNISTSISSSLYKIQESDLLK